MSLSELIDRLQELQNYYGDHHEVSIMTEFCLRNKDSKKIIKEVQLKEDITDVVFSKNEGIILIGKELD